MALAVARAARGAWATAQGTCNASRPRLPAGCPHGLAGLLLDTGLRQAGRAASPSACCALAASLPALPLPTHRLLPVCREGQGEAKFKPAADTGNARFYARMDPGAWAEELTAVEAVEARCRPPGFIDLLKPR